MGLKLLNILRKNLQPSLEFWWKRKADNELDFMASDSTAKIYGEIRIVFSTILLSRFQEIYFWFYSVKNFFLNESEILY